jgi:hypothetical protein
MLVPAHVLEYFEIWDAKKYKACWVIEAVKHRLPFQGAYRIIPFYTQGVAAGYNLTGKYNDS